MEELQWFLLVGAFVAEVGQSLNRGADEPAAEPADRVEESAEETGFAPHVVVEEEHVLRAGGTEQEAALLRHSPAWEMTLDPHPSALRLEHAKHRGDARFAPDPVRGLIADHHVEGRVLLSGEARADIVDAREIITMEDDPSTATRRKKDSSMSVALKMLRSGEGDAVVSAGSTGALLTGATLTAKRIPGIRRAALAPVLPNGARGVMLID